MTSCAMPSSTSPVQSLEDIECLLALMKSFGVAICELPGGLKFVMAPDMSQPVRPTNAVPDEPPPRTVHDDPMLYMDGVVPDFRSF